MRFPLYIFIFFVMVFSAIAADSWHEPDAKYRIEVSTDMPDLPGYADFNRICLPDKSLDNGVSVYEPSGKKLPYILNLKNRGVVFGDDKDSSKRFIYFGYSKPVAADFNAAEIGKTVKRSPLRLTVLNCHIPNVSLDEWIKQKLIHLERRHSGSINYAKARIPSDRQAYLNAERKYGPERDKLAEISRNIRNRISRLQRDIATEKRKLSSAANKLKAEKRKKRNKKNIAQYQDQVNTLNKRVRALYSKLDAEYKSLKKNDKEYSKVRRNVDRLRGRYEWSHRDLQNREENREKDIKKLMVSAKEENARELEFMRYFSPDRKLREIGTCLAEKIYLTNMPFGHRSGFAAEFKGTLVADKDGEYTFAVDSTSNVLLFIDDEMVINWYGDRKANDDWSKNCKLKLSRGLHDFKLYYKRANRSQEAYIEAAWKKPGDKDFTVMSELDFAPGRRTSLTSFSDAAGHRYPLVKADRQISIFTGKKERLFWINCKSLNGLAPEWLIGDRKVAHGSPVSLFYKDDMKKEFGIKQEHAPVIVLTIPEYETSRKIHTPAKLDMKLWLPDFIYDDENLNSYLEIFSGLPAEVTCSLGVAGDKRSNPFENISGKYTVSGMVNDPKRRFEPDSSLKFMVPLEGKALKDGVTVNFDLEAGGIDFAKKTVRFVPLDAIFQLETDEDGFVDANGSRIVPVLHRPGLDELRRWQLPALFMSSMFVPTKVLVVANDFGQNGDSFFSELEKQFKAAGMEAEFVEWKIGQPGINGLPDVMRTIRNSDAGAAVIIPPHLDPVSTPRRQRRLLSALIQLMRTNSDIKLIKLATPFPGNKDEESIANIKKISREYGIDILSLNSYVKQLCAGDEIEQKAEDNTFPLSHKAEIAEFIAGEKW